MKNIFLITLITAFLFACNSTNIDSSDWSGITSQSDERSMIVDKLAKGYTSGNFGIASEYFGVEGGALLTVIVCVFGIIWGYINIIEKEPRGQEHSAPTGNIVVHSGRVSNDTI